MEVVGRVQNGVVVLEGGVSLPEGAAVRVLCGAAPAIHVSPIRKPVKLPLVRSSVPGSVHLTNEMIGEILDEQDASS